MSTFLKKFLVILTIYCGHTSGMMAMKNSYEDLVNRLVAHGKHRILPEAIGLYGAYDIARAGSEAIDLALFLEVAVIPGRSIEQCIAILEENNRILEELQKKLYADYFASIQTMPGLISTAILLGGVYGLGKSFSWASHLYPKGKSKAEITENQLLALMVTTCFSGAAIATRSRNVEQMVRDWWERYKIKKFFYHQLLIDLEQGRNILKMLKDVSAMRNKL